MNSNNDRAFALFFLSESTETSDKMLQQGQYSRVLESNKSSSEKQNQRVPKRRIRWASKTALATALPEQGIRLIAFAMPINDIHCNSIISMQSTASHIIRVTIVTEQEEGAMPTSIKSTSEAIQAGYKPFPNSPNTLDCLTTPTNHPLASTIPSRHQFCQSLECQTTYIIWYTLR